MHVPETIEKSKSSVEKGGTEKIAKPGENAHLLLSILAHGAILDAEIYK
jgi:hypothetical protein